jgi:predicted TPR repeat methyltransferase
MSTPATPHEATPHEATPYDALAAGYDVVMEHVDYEFWADFVHDLIERHQPNARDVLELGCGTGSLALELQPMGPYRYVGTDGSQAMIHVAERKAEFHGVDVQFAVADFTSFRTDALADVVVLVYDGLNYLVDPADVRSLFASATRALKPGGLFVFDVSTPTNSANNEADFQDEGEAEGFSYVRTSRYDEDARLHTTDFELTILGQTFHETHVQRAYTLEEVRALLPSDLEEVAAYDGFSDAQASEASERVHLVVRRSAQPA